ncbi:MAG TPA: class I SAM-dependent methyltransferase, partial [Chloroflexota bacterium]|nr:class I SAM-dependent methyltransferase [Chloroflexota bacterium]
NFIHGEQAVGVTPAEERIRNNPASELWGEHRSRYRFVSQLASRGSRVLDVACGSGFGLQMLLRAGACPIGIDLDVSALAEARAVAPAAAVVRAEAARLPLPTASIDLVASFETIEHVSDAAALAAELRRVLRPGGWLVLSTPNRAFGPPERLASNPYHVREFSGEELLDLLRQHFEEVRLHGQWVAPSYRYVPYLLVEPRRTLAAVIWKVLNRLPFAVKDALAWFLSGRPFYPGEADYAFVPDRWQGAHALLALAR